MIARESRRFPFLFSRSSDNGHLPAGLLLPRSLPPPRNAPPAFSSYTRRGSSLFPFPYIVSCYTVLDPRRCSGFQKRETFNIYGELSPRVPQEEIPPRIPLPTRTFILLSCRNFLIIAVRATLIILTLDTPLGTLAASFSIRVFRSVAECIPLPAAFCPTCDSCHGRSYRVAHVRLAFRNPPLVYSPVGPLAILWNFRADVWRR